MSPTAKSMRPGADVGGQRSRAKRTSVGARSMRQHVGAAPRQLDRHRAGAAAGVEHARAGQIGRQPGRAEWRASGRGPRAPSRGCGRAARRRSAASRPRPRCGRNRSGARRGAARRYECRASVESQEIEDVAVLHRVARSSGSVPAQRVSASRRYSACTASSLGRGLHLEQRRLLQPRAADHVEVGEVGDGASGRSPR